MLSSFARKGQSPKPCRFHLSTTLTRWQAGAGSSPGSSSLQEKHLCGSLFPSRVTAGHPPTLMLPLPDFLHFLPSEPVLILFPSQYPAVTAVLHPPRSALSVLQRKEATNGQNLTKDLRKRGRNFPSTQPSPSLDLRPKIKHSQLFKRQMFIRYIELKKKTTSKELCKKYI